MDSQRFARKEARVNCAQAAKAFARYQNSVPVFAQRL